MKHNNTQHIYGYPPSILCSFSSTSANPYRYVQNEKNPNTGRGKASFLISYSQPPFSFFPPILFPLPQPPLNTINLSENIISD